MPAVEFVADLPVEVRANLGAQRFTVRSSLQEPSDQWDAEVAGVDDYLNTSTARRIDLDVGLEDGLGGIQSVRVLRGGVVDEWALQLRHDGQGGTQAVSLLKGRDPLSVLLETESRRRYLRHPAKVELLGSSDVEEVVGIFRARTVAEEVAAAAGLSLVWQCRDYELWEDFDAVGRPVDLIARLVEPWNSVEPSRVDVFGDGTTVFVRQRTAFPAAADYVYEVQRAAPGPHVRATGITIRRSRLPVVGPLELLGRAEAGTQAHAFEPPEGQQGVSSVNVEVIPLSREIDPLTGAKTITPGRVTQTNTSRSFGQDGRVVARVEERITYQMPNQVPIEVTRDTYSLVNEQPGADPQALAADSAAAGQSLADFQALVTSIALAGAAAGGGGEKLVKRELKTTDYQPFTYDDKGPTNSPLPLREYATVYRYVDETSPAGITSTVFKQDTEETTTHAYDEDGYLRTTSTVVKRDQDGVLTPETMIVKHYATHGPLMFSVQTDRYAFREEQTVEEQGGSFEGAAGGASEVGQSNLATVTRLLPFLVQSDFAVVGGHRPGGPNRPPTKPINSELVGLITLPILSRPTVSTQAGAPSAEGGGSSMSAADLAFIAAQRAEASGAWEIEIEFTALSMPWLRRGTLVRLSGVLGEADQPVPVGNALIYSVVLDYDAQARRSVSTIRAVWWEPAT